MSIERFWDGLTDFFNALTRGIEQYVTSLFGSSNARYVRKLYPRVAAINALEPEMQKLTDEELRAKTDEFREQLRNGETLDDLLIEAFAVCREASVRYGKMGKHSPRCYIGL